MGFVFLTVLMMIVIIMIIASALPAGLFRIGGGRTKEVQEMQMSPHPSPQAFLAWQPCLPTATPVLLRLGGSIRRKCWERQAEAATGQRGLGGPAPPLSLCRLCESSHRKTDVTDTSRVQFPREQLPKGNLKPGPGGPPWRAL